MKRRTQTAPHIFNVGEEEFKSQQLGFLAAGEITLKYLPTLFKLMEQFKGDFQEAEDIVDDETAAIDITKIIAELPEGFLTDLSKDLLINTQVRDIREDAEGNRSFLPTYSKVNPEDFEDMTEFIKVLIAVFKHNFPNFFPKGRDLEEELEQSLPTNISPTNPQLETENSPKRIKL